MEKTKGRPWSWLLFVDLRRRYQQSIRDVQQHEVQGQSSGSEESC